MGTFGRKEGGQRKVNLKNQNLTEIPVHLLHQEMETLVLSNNPISSLRNLPKFMKLETLFCRNTQIKEFGGIIEQPNLLQVTFEGSPITKQKYYRLMTAVIFGRSLLMIDDVPISIYERELRDSISPMIRNYLLQGFILVSYNPTVLVNELSGEEKTLPLPPMKTLFDKPIKNVVVEDKDDIELYILKKVKQHVTSHANAPRTPEPKRKTSTNLKRASETPDQILSSHKDFLQKFNRLTNSRRIAFSTPTEDNKQDSTMSSIDPNDISIE